MFGQSQGNIIYLRVLIKITIQHQPFSRPLAGIISTIVAFSCIKALVGKFDLAIRQFNVIRGPECDQNIMGHGPVCYIPKFMEIESLVPRDKVFKAFQNIWAWKPSGYVTNIPISSYLKVYIQNFVKKAKWFLLLALKFDLCVKYVKVNPWALFIHTMVCLM